MRRLALALAVLATLPATADAAKPRKVPRVLVYSGTVGYHHRSIEVGNAVLARLGRLTGRFRTKVIEKPEELTPARLARTDTVLWNSTTGAESPFTEEQEAAYMNWVSCGGGHVGVHASTDSYRDWPGWAELTGAFFKVHPVTPTSAMDDQTPAQYEGYGEPEARVLVVDETSPLTAPWHGQDLFLHRDEFYALDADPASVITGFRPLLAFGGFTDPTVAAIWDAQYADEQPLSWTGTYRGKGRIFYTNLGHSGGTWLQPEFQDSLLAGISWVAKKRRSC